MIIWKNKTVIAVAIGIGMMLMILIIAWSFMLQLWQMKLSDHLFTKLEPSSEIIIVDISDVTVDEKSGIGPMSTWSRNYYAKVVENLEKYHPKLIAFDIYFKDHRDNEGDLKFAQALQKTAIPIIVFPSYHPYLDTDDYFKSSAEEIHGLPINILSNNPNITLSLNNAIPDTDNTIRRILPGVQDQQDKKYYESLSFAVVRGALSLPPVKPIPQLSLNQYAMTQNGPIIPLENGQMIINFASASWKDKSYQKIPFHKVLQENYDNFNPQNFKDKIVLIGTSAKSVNDSHITPKSSMLPMPGVEIHANAIQTILDQKFLRNMTFGEQAGLLLILCVASALTFMFTKIRWSVTYLVAVLGIYTLVAPVAFQNGLILDLVHPYLAIVSVFIATYMYRYLTEFKEKNILKNAFTKYVNPEIMRQIVDNPASLKLGGQKREITVLFTDIVHFTTISENLQPESLIAVLNEYFQAMSAIILEEGGTLDKFEGDAIMAFFGAPLEQSDHALRACRVAVKMRYKLYELLEQWKKEKPLPGGENWPAIDFRCGINSGEAIVGNVGSMDRLEYTVIGDNVNLGSRLEGANKKYQTHIMVSETTYKKVQTEFEARELDIIRVVGKTKPIKVYEILGFKGSLPPNAVQLLKLYNEGMALYQKRKYAEALAKFNEILQSYTTDGPSFLYKQRCEVLKEYPPREGWDGVFVMPTK